MHENRKAMEDKEENTPELGDLYPDAIRAVFSRIPLKPLIKLKRVSRTWRDFITDFHRRQPPTTADGLVVLLHHSPAAVEPILQESILLPPPQKRPRRHLKPFLKKSILSRHRRHNFPLFLRCSCNGLLLYDGGSRLPYYLCDAFHGQCVAIPRADEGTRQVQVGLAFDGFGSGFLVVCIFLQEVDFEKGLVNCRIFSSENWEWREIAAIVQNIGLMDIEKGFDQAFCSSSSSSLYLDGRIYWIWSICMLQFDTENESFKLFSLPLKPEKLVTPLLYESDGQIYFCYRYTDDLLHIFKFNDRAHDVYKWQLRLSVSLQECIPKKRKNAYPCAFNQDLQELILVVPPARIVSYSLETGRFSEVWSGGEMEGHTTYISKVLPLLFKSVHLFDKCSCSCTASSEKSYFTTKLFQES